MNQYSLFTLELLSDFLNNHEGDIEKRDIESITKLGFSEEYAFALLLCTMYGIDTEENREWFYEYLLASIKMLDVKEYSENPYYKNIFIKNKISNKWNLKHTSYKAYEGFVYDDMYLKDEKVLFNIGFFKEKFDFPAIYEKDRLWMSISPNEINTMKESINNAYGNVLVLGMGLGYYPYMISLKENVKSIRVVDVSKDALDIFEECIYPQFSRKIVKLINMDAFEYLENIDSDIDYVFCDLWHDASDGKDLYLKLKKFEEKYKNIKFDYWIEKTIKYYL